MRVAIYHPWVYLKSGLERTLLELKRRSRHDWTILTSHYDAEGTYPELRDMGVVELRRVSVKRRYGTVIRAAATVALTRVPMEKYDALVISCEGLGSLLNFRNHDKPIVCLCFTPLRAVYDPAYRAVRFQSAGRAWRLPFTWMVETAFRCIDRLAWRYYSRVFCISETVKRRVLEAGLVSPDRIEVAYPGIDGTRIEASDTFESFFFLPGRIMWTKNVELGIEAFLRLQRQTPCDFTLIIAGMVDEKSKPYIARLRELAAESDKIQFVIGPSDEEMFDLYRRCYATIFTAFNEDLGLTPLEAMTFGKPTIAVRRGGPCETIIDKVNGRLAEPDPEAFCTIMSEFVRNPGTVKELGRNGLKQAGKFTWDVFVAQIDDYLDQLSLKELKV